MALPPKSLLTSWWTGNKLSTIRNVTLLAPGGLQCSRLSVQHGRSASSHRPALTLARCSVAAHCALLRVLATPALRASDVRKLTRGSPCFTGLIGGYCTLNSQWSSCCALRLAVLRLSSSAWSPLCVRKAHLRCFLLHWAHRRLLQPLAAPPLFALIGLTTACFPQAAAFVRLQFPLKSYGFSGAETARKRFLLWKMGFSDAAYCEPCPSIQHGRPTPSHRPALTLARCSAPADFASLRVLGAPAASRPPTLASSLAELPASLGSSYRPALRWPGIPGLRSASRCPRPFTPFGASRQRPVSRTARGLRAPPPYTPPGTIKTRKGFVPQFVFPFVLAAYAYWYFVSSAWYSGHFS